MYDVMEVSRILGVSKVTIYKKIKKIDKLKEYIVNKDRKTYLLKEGINVLKKDLNYKINSFNNEIKIKEIDKDTEKSLIDILKEQLAEKDLQLKEKDIQIQELINLNKNNQVLLKQQQDKEIKILQLEAHFEEVDKKLIELKGKLEDKKKNSKNIWDKFRIK